MPGGCVLALPLPKRHLQVVGERALETLRLPELAAELVCPERAQLLRHPLRERGLPGRLGADEDDALDQRRVHERVHPAAVGVRVGADHRPRRRYQRPRLVDQDVRRAQETRKPLVAGLAREDAVEAPQERDAVGVDLGVRRIVGVRVVGKWIFEREDVLSLRIELAQPAEPQLDRHPLAPGPPAVVDDDREVVDLREGRLDHQLVAAMQRQELPEDEPALHATATPAGRPAACSRRSSRTHWNQPTKLIAW